MAGERGIRQRGRRGGEDSKTRNEEHSCPLVELVRERFPNKEIVQARGHLSGPGMAIACQRILPTAGLQRARFGPPFSDSE